RQAWRAQNARPLARRNPAEIAGRTSNQNYRNITMLRGSRLLAGVLAVVFLAAVFPATAGVNSFGRTSQSCHHGMPPNPVPSRRDHRCCVSDHPWALPGLFVVLRPLPARVEAHLGRVRTSRPLGSDHGSSVSSDSPPSS